MIGSPGPEILSLLGLDPEDGESHSDGYWGDMQGVHTLKFDGSRSSPRNDVLPIFIYDGSAPPIYPLRSSLKKIKLKTA
jgi:hypothetical protein